MGTDIYRNKIMGHNIIQQRILVSLNNTLHAYREGNSISIPLIQTLIRSFIYFRNLREIRRILSEFPSTIQTRRDIKEILFQSTLF